MRYYKNGLLGEGQFGEVHKAIDADTGKVMAVKILKQALGQVAMRLNVEREVGILSRARHVSVT